VSDPNEAHATNSLPLLKKREEGLIVRIALAFGLIVFLMLDFVLHAPFAARLAAAVCFVLCSLAAILRERLAPSKRSLAIILASAAALALPLALVLNAAGVSIGWSAIWGACWIALAVAISIAVLPSCPYRHSTGHDSDSTRVR
jgi:hypothetical protein